MSTAADDRNIRGKRVKKRARMGKEALRAALADADAECERRIKAAVSKAADIVSEIRQQRDAAREANKILAAGRPLLGDLSGRWLRAGFFRRVWYAAVYVFKGSGAFRSTDEGGSK